MVKLFMDGAFTNGMAYMTIRTKRHNHRSAETALYSTKYAASSLEPACKDPRLPAPAAAALVEERREGDERLPPRRRMAGDEGVEDFAAADRREGLLLLPLLLERFAGAAARRREGEREEESAAAADRERDRERVIGREGEELEPAADDDDLRADIVHRTLKLE